MRPSHRTIAIAVLLLGSSAAPAPGFSSPEFLCAGAVAAGLGLNLPLVARLVGAGSTLYVTTVDVQNNAAASTQVD